MTEKEKQLQAELDYLKELLRKAEPYIWESPAPPRLWRKMREALGFVHSRLS